MALVNGCQVHLPSSAKLSPKTLLRSGTLWLTNTQYGPQGVLLLTAKVLSNAPGQRPLWRLQACYLIYPQPGWVRLVSGETGHLIFLTSFMLFLKTELLWVTLPYELPTRCSWVDGTG